jgi:hypothetical protein
MALDMDTKFTGIKQISLPLSSKNLRLLATADPEQYRSPKKNRRRNSKIPTATFPPFDLDIKQNILASKGESAPCWHHHSTSAERVSISRQIRYSTPLSHVPT